MKTGKPTIPDILPLLLAYYAKPGNAVGGSLYTIMENGNIQDKHVQYCLDSARANGDDDGVLLAEMLLRMSKTQRSRLCMTWLYPWDSH